MAAQQTATLTVDGQSFELPILSGSMGPRAIDVRPLYTQTDKFTFDPGFMSTAACQSSITYVDGETGVLLYRGYPIEQLIRQCDFLEVAHLLLHGELPNATSGTNSKASSSTRRWCMSSWRGSIRASDAMRIRWPSSSAWSARCPPSTMKR